VFLSREKLVRDKVPEILRSTGRAPEIRIASADELDLLLREKLVEEASELLESGSLEELADILEVIRKLLEIRNTSMRRLQSLRARKRDERGGFDRGFVLHLTD